MVTDDNTRLTAQARFIKGDGADWCELWQQGQIDDLTLYEKTGFTPGELAMVIVPRAQAQAIISGQ